MSTAVLQRKRWLIMAVQITRNMSGVNLSIPIWHLLNFEDVIRLYKYLRLEFLPGAGDFSHTHNSCHLQLQPRTSHKMIAPAAQNSSSKTMYKLNK